MVFILPHSSSMSMTSDDQSHIWLHKGAQYYYYYVGNVVANQATIDEFHVIKAKLKYVYENHQVINVWTCSSIRCIS